MNEPQKSKKRIVSKGEYLTRISKKTAIGLGGISLVGGGCFVFLLAVCCLCIGVLLWSESVLVGLLWLTGFVLVLALAFGTFHVSSKYMERARQIDPGVPLTRHNTADLPSTDSLVRASSEPLQAQEAVLLRAAAQGQPVHEEQLLRATVE